MLSFTLCKLIAKFVSYKFCQTVQELAAAIHPSVSSCKLRVVVDAATIPSQDCHHFLVSASASLLQPVQSRSHIAFDSVVSASEFQAVSGPELSPSLIESKACVGNFPATMVLSVLVFDDIAKEMKNTTILQGGKKGLCKTMAYNDALVNIPMSA